MKIPFHHLVLVVLTFFAPTVGFAQVVKKCPTIWVDGPTTEVEAGTSIVFTARLTGLSAMTQPKFRWELSAGTIMVGQGTASVTVDSTGLGGAVVTAKVFVGGVSRDCPTQASRSSNVLLSGFACGLPFDSYGDIDFEDEKARLDNFVIQLFNQETSTGYIFVYAGRRSYEGEAAERLLRAKDYLVKHRRMSPERIITIDGGYKEDLAVTLMIAPQGATAPVAMPTLSPGEIELTKPRP
jgi:hypothetical protein